MPESPSERPSENPPEKNPVVSGAEFLTYSGRTMLPSRWLTITQERIDQFADVTDDHQFIHVDPRRAAETPLGTTIAHGFLSLSLLSVLSAPDWPSVKNTVMAFNYGLDRVRFLTPVKVNSRVRVHTKVRSVREKRPGEFVVRAEKSMEIEGSEKPAFIVMQIGLLVTEPD